MATPAPYRDDHDALEDRRRDLTEQLDAVRAQRRALDDLTRQEAGLAAELEAIDHRLTALRARRALPVLEDVRIATPCNATWEAMEGDERVRFCAQCSKHVYNLSGMTRAEAEALLRERAGELCVRLYQRADGTVLTADCPEGARQRRRRRLVAAAALAGGGAFAAAALDGLATNERPEAVQVLKATAMPEPPQVTPPPVEVRPELTRPIRPRMGKPMLLNRRGSVFD